MVPVDTHPYPVFEFWRDSKSTRGWPVQHIYRLSNPSSWLSPNHARVLTRSREYSIWNPEPGVTLVPQYIDGLDNEIDQRIDLNKVKPEMREALILALSAPTCAANPKHLTPSGRRKLKAAKQAAISEIKERCSYRLGPHSQKRFEALARLGDLNRLSELEQALGNGLDAVQYDVLVSGLLFASSMSHPSETDLDRCDAYTRVWRLLSDLKTLATRGVLEKKDSRGISISEHLQRWVLEGYPLRLKNSGLNQSQLYAQFIEELVDHDQMTQRAFGTCTAGAVQSTLVHVSIADYVRMVTELCLDGATTKPSGTLLRYDINGSDPVDVPPFYRRGAQTRAFQGAFMQDAVHSGDYQSAVTVDPNDGLPKLGVGGRVYGASIGSRLKGTSWPWRLFAYIFENSELRAKKNVGGLWYGELRFAIEDFWGETYAYVDLRRCLSKSTSCTEQKILLLGERHAMHLAGFDAEKKTLYYYDPAYGFDSLRSLSLKDAIAEDYELLMPKRLLSSKR